MTIRNKDNTEDTRVEVQGRRSLENHPHLSSVQRKRVLQDQTNTTLYHI